MNKRKQNRELVLLLFPGIGFLVLFFGFPLLRALFGSFGLVGGSSNGFTFSYYREVLSSSIYVEGLFFTMYYALVPVVISLIIAIPLASIMQSNYYGKKLFNGLYKIPLAIPSIVVTFMALTMLDLGGFINRITDSFGWEYFPRLVRDKLALGVLISLSWKNIPFMLLIIGGSFASISEDIINAARTLGAGKIRSFFLIKVPMAKPGITAAVLLSFISSMGTFVVPSVIGPTYPLPLSILMFESLKLGEWSMVYAAGMVLTAFAIVILILYYTITSKKDETR